MPASRFVPVIVSATDNPEIYAVFGVGTDPALAGAPPTASAADGSEPVDLTAVSGGVPTAASVTRGSGILGPSPGTPAIPVVVVSPQTTRSSVRTAPAAPTGIPQEIDDRARAYLKFHAVFAAGQCSSNVYSPKAYFKYEESLRELARSIEAAILGARDPFSHMSVQRLKKFTDAILADAGSWFRNTTDMDRRPLICMGKLLATIARFTTAVTQEQALTALLLAAGSRSFGHTGKEELCKLLPLLPEPVALDLLQKMARLPTFEYDTCFTSEEYKKIVNALPSGPVRLAAEALLTQAQAEARDMDRKRFDRYTPGSIFIFGKDTLAKSGVVLPPGAPPSVFGRLLSVHIDDPGQGTTVEGLFMIKVLSHPDMDTIWVRGPYHTPTRPDSSNIFDTVKGQTITLNVADQAVSGLVTEVTQTVELAWGTADVIDHYMTTVTIGGKDYTFDSRQPLPEIQVVKTP